MRKQLAAAVEANQTAGVSKCHKTLIVLFAKYPKMPWYIDPSRIQDATTFDFGAHLPTKADQKKWLLVALCKVLDSPTKEEFVHHVQESLPNIESADLEVAWKQERTNKEKAKKTKKRKAGDVPDDVVGVVPQAHGREAPEHHDE